MKQIFDELKTVSSSISDLKDSLSERIDGVKKTLGERFHTLESAAQIFDDWKPRIESSVEDLNIEIGALRKTVNRIVLDSPSSGGGIFSTPVSAMAPPFAGFTNDGPAGHL